MKRDEDTDKIHIRATIMRVERDSQKGLVNKVPRKLVPLLAKDIEVSRGQGLP